MFGQPGGEQSGAAAAPAWAITFADLMTLLMTFFVLLYSFSSLEAEKFREVAGEIRMAFGSGAPIPEGPGVQTAPSPESDAEMLVQLRKILAVAGAEGERVERGVALRLPGETLFDPGKAELRAEAAPLLEHIAEVAEQRGGSLEVEGHTDDVPIATAAFPSNWELSSARAASVVRRLVTLGIAPERLRAVGLADTQPVAANDSPENRARNRRVEFVFVKGPWKPRSTPQPSSLEPVPLAPPPTPEDRIRQLFKDVLDDSAQGETR